MRLRVGVRARVASASAPLRSLDPSTSRWQAGRQPGLGRSAGSFYRGTFICGVTNKARVEGGSHVRFVGFGIFFPLCLALPTRSSVCKIAIASGASSPRGWGRARSRVNYGVVNDLGCLIRANSGGISSSRPPAVYVRRRVYTLIQSYTCERMQLDHLCPLQRLSSVPSSSSSQALFSSKKFCKIEIVALSFVFDKYYPIMD